MFTQTPFRMLQILKHSYKTLQHLRHESNGLWAKRRISLMEKSFEYLQNPTFLHIETSLRIEKVLACQLHFPEGQPIYHPCFPLSHESLPARQIRSSTFCTNS